MSIDLLLIHPPVVRPSEPPLATAILAGHLARAGVRVETLDLNVELFDILLGPGPEDLPEGDAFSRRALRHRAASLALLRSPRATHDPARYRSAISHLGRLLWLRTDREDGLRITLTDCHHPRLSPLRSRDLVAAAAAPEPRGPEEHMARVILDRIRRDSPRWVGLSMNYLSQVLPTMAIVGLLRRCCPGLPVVVGGSMVTAWAPRIRENPGLRALVDQWIPGPGEEPLARLLAPGALPRAGLARPIFEGFPWGLYLSPRRVVPFLTARGCYWGRCRFCPESLLGGAFRPAPARETLDLVRDSLRRSGASWVHFMDDAIPPSMLKALAQEALGARWFGFVRFEASLLDAAHVRRLRGAGCRMLQLGLESGSQRVLDAMNKGIRLDVASRILRILHEEGIGTYVYAMFGMPGETVEDARRTLDFLSVHAPWIDFLNCAVMNLPHGEAPVEGLRRVPFSPEEDLSLYTDFRCPAGMDRRQARGFLQRELRRHPAVAPILRRDPPAFTSSHAPFFLDCEDGVNG